MFSAVFSVVTQSLTHLGSDTNLPPNYIQFMRGKWDTEILFPTFLSLSIATGGGKEKNLKYISKHASPNAASSASHFTTELLETLPFLETVGLPEFESCPPADPVPSSSHSVNTMSLSGDIIPVPINGKCQNSAEGAGNGSSSIHQGAIPSSSCSHLPQFENSKF